MISLALSCPVRTKRRGFSLIELLVTIAVIAILAAIIIPVTGYSRNSALQVQNMSNLRSISTALLSYAADNGGTLPMNRMTGGYRIQGYYGMGVNTGVFRLIGERFKPGTLQPEGEGYVESADIFYGPFTPKFNEQRAPAPSGFYEFRGNSMYLGYMFYSLAVTDAGVGADARTGPGPINESIMVGDPLAPLSADHVDAGVREAAGRPRMKVAVAHLNGSISLMPEELNDLGSSAGIRYMANWRGNSR